MRRSSNEANRPAPDESGIVPDSAAAPAHDCQKPAPPPVDTAGSHASASRETSPTTTATAQETWEGHRLSSSNGSNEPKDGSISNRIGVPDGGLRAWIVVAGGFIDFMVAFGLINSFGTFQARYDKKWTHLSTSAITWIGSVQLFILFLGGLFVGPAFDRFGCGPLMKSGTAFCFISFLCAGWSKEYWHFLMSQGVLFGIGNALLFYPATSAISEWFNEKRGLALGIAISGSSIGGIFWPMLIEYLYKAVAEDMVHRIICVVATPLLLMSCWMVRERKGVAGHDTAGNKAADSKKSLLAAVTDVRFMALSVCLTVLYCGMLVPFYFIPMYAADNGIDATMATNLLAITYTGSFISRIGAGWLADRFGRFNILFLMSVVMSAVTMCWIWMTSLSANVAFAVLFGLFSGGLMPLGSACVAQTTKDMGQIGLRIGIMMAISSVGALAGGPVGGFIKDGTNSWVGVHLFAASTAMTGACMLISVRFWHKRPLLAKF
ncbi:hypothetical protein CDD81_52 [Ophiocordyceps australis]|uniref:Major facilitator superfamily (MFS) profile domain-containing protein n=1 Tax=Ophiocordyceps australis TaxID=1399860 RepID=A0A2C5YIW9_9HYPO|nr:hypothetical protein CDD81_52 [Ophiocordyceps australis]